MFSQFLSMLDFSFSITGPIFMLVSLGVVLKKLKVIDWHFMDKASKLVFILCLPILIFTSIVKTDLQSVLNPSLLIVSALTTLLVFILLSISAPLFVKNFRDRGVFIQGAFRGNLAIVGLAFCANAYGAQGVAKASILMSILILFYNILSVYTLSASLSKNGVKLKSLLSYLLKNPIIIGILLAIPINVIDISIHPVIMKTGEYIAQLTLPLALICIGGTLSFTALKSSSVEVFSAVIAKLILTPAIIVFIAFLCGFSQMDLGIIFLMASTPTAAASYVMVQAMDGNAQLAANIIVLSTLASIATVSLGLVILKTFAMI